MLSALCPRHGRRSTRGAASLVMLMLMGTVLTGGVGAIDAAVVVGSQAHAQSAADAVAHGVAVQVLRDPEEEQLSITAQAGSFCDSDETDNAGAGRACMRAIGTARELAVQNDAVLRRLIVGPDARDRGGPPGAGRVLVQAEVAMPRRLPVLPAWCPPQPRPDAGLCWAQAWAAAQGAG
jgi:hypothetical protein